MAPASRITAPLHRPKTDEKGCYVVVFGGARDHYQAAIALNEVGCLEVLVNELYVPAIPSWLRVLIRVMDRRNRSRARENVDLPSERVTISWVALIFSFLNRFWPSSTFVRGKDRALGRACGNIAAKRGLPVLAYSYYASYAFERMPSGLSRIIFQVSAHADTVRRILSEEIKRAPWAKESLSKEHELNFPAAYLDRLCREAREADFAVTPSVFAKQTLIDAGLDEARIAVVPFGIDTKFFTPKKFTSSANRPLRLIFVGALLQRKGLGYLFQAMKRLAGEPVELAIVGRGMRDDIMMDHFAEVPRRVIWNEPRARLVAELQWADVFVFPSLVDSFGHVILEAMATGLPVITTTNTAGPDLVEEGRTGFIGAIRDVDYLEAKIRWFLGNRDAIPSMGRECQEEASKRTWPRFRAEMREALESR